MLLASASPAHENIAMLLVELGAILLALGMLGQLSRALHIPVIPLYLVAGLCFGNGGIISLSTSTDFLNIAADIGVILLLVMLGLEYSAEELKSSLRRQAPMGLLDGLLNATPGVLVALIAGWGALAAVALGGITWVSSSGVVAKMLSDSGRLGNREVPAVLGVLVLEDLMMAVYLPLLTALLAAGGASSVIIAMVIAVGAVCIILIVATRYGHWVTRLVSAQDAESLLLGVLGLTLLVAGVADALKVSSAVGAFLVGIALSGTVAEKAVELLTPLRDVFAAAFFVAFGLTTSPRLMVPMLPLAILLTVLTAGTKVATGHIAARRAGVKRRGRWRAGVALIPRGEFSVIIATLTVAAGAVTSKLAPLTAGYVLSTIILAAAVQKLPDLIPLESRR